MPKLGIADNKPACVSEVPRSACSAGIRKIPQLMNKKAQDVTATDTARINQRRVGLIDASLAFSFITTDYVTATHKHCMCAAVTPGRMSRDTLGFLLITTESRSGGSTVIPPVGDRPSHIPPVDSPEIKPTRLPSTSRPVGAERALSTT
jgi:hypothetical protein